jgi:hypothetical protein
MFLKRLAHGFRSQDWFTVFVELFVLIFGVFLGLQVDDWNQRRLDRIEEQYYLDRLGRDFERSLIEQDRQLETAKNKFETSLSILQALESRDFGEMTDSEFRNRLSRLWGFPALSLVTATTDELVANGKASLLQSNTLREELATFVEWYEDRERYYEYLSGSIIDAYQSLFDFAKPEWPVLESRPRWSADADVMMNDAKVISAMRQLTSAYSQLWRDLSALNRETHEINDLLNKEIRGTE